ncbi:glycosyltransferase [uncultured Jatrophihabitans sp.]|uniref:glycosyltransferase n=1 Tax=uncultured Jatrophihabitans sp. TaxID=1610747 RepID=UPI0035CBB1EA
MPIRVLQSFPEPTDHTNPYLVLLRRSLEDTQLVEVLPFTWRTALIGRYDVVHLHWPEALLSASSPLRRVRRELLMAAWTVRLVVTRTPVVRTVHNVGLPQGLPRRDTALIRFLYRLTRAAITLNARTDPGANIPSAVIPHGDYRPWLEGLARTAPVAGRLVYFGQVRRYKGLDSLLPAYADARRSAPDVSLTIGGRPTSIEIERDVRAAAADLPDVRLELRHLSDAEMTQLVGEAELVVLPYRFMHNSGSVLYALSLERPVLVPDNDVNRDLADEAGPGWLYLFAGDLNGQVIIDALSALRTSPPAAPPDLSRRAWGAAGAAHARLYRDVTGQTS